jgi:potassium-transporting ATPase KdpC subunit
MKTLLQHLRMLLTFSFALGLIYPFWITFFSELCAKDKATGSLVFTHGTCKGSRLLGQKFVKSSYFWPRPSVCDYNPLLSGASNLGPTSKRLQNTVRGRLFFLAEAHGIQDLAKIPRDLLFASGSGLDPHISPEAALFQIDRVSKARGFTEKGKAKLGALVREHIENRSFHFLGESCVNVLELNLALEELAND